MKVILTFFLLFPLAIYSQSWRVTGNMPVSVTGAQAVVHGSEIYILGGFSEVLNSKVNLIQEFDPQNNNWGEPDSMRIARANFIAGVFSDSVFYAGGTSTESNYSNSMEAWDFNSSPQIFKTDNFFNRDFTTGQIVNGSFYFFGGDDHEDDSQSPYMFEYNLKKSQVTFSNNSIYNAVFPSQQMSAVLGNYIYIFGGALGVLSNTILRFNISDRSFKVISAELQKPRARGVAIPFGNNKIYIIGGMDETNQALSTVEVFTVNGDSALVSQGPSLNYARVDPIAVNYYNNIYVFGGSDKNGQPVSQIEELGPVSTVVSSKSTLPNSFELENNYPNPFNPSTHIKFKIALPAKVSVNIYSILGKLIKNLTSKYYQPGEYDLTWNGDNNLGNFVPSGVYIYRLTCGYFSTSKKMILLK